MSNDEAILIEAVIQKKTGISPPIQVKIYCKYQYAVSWFSDKKLARKLTEAEASSGKKISYNEERNLVVERFVGKSAMEVAGIIRKQLEKAGGKIRE